MIPKHLMLQQKKKHTSICLADFDDSIELILSLIRDGIVRRKQSFGLKNPTPDFSHKAFSSDNSDQKI